MQAIERGGVEVTLVAGETLYLPCCWWHAVRGGEGPNLSLNYWYNMREDKMDQSTDAAMRSMMASVCLGGS